VKGNYCLVGDAAHATTPHCGAGAGMAIEDAHLLSALLTPDLIKSRRDIKYAFNAYDQIRRPRSQALVAQSRSQGMLLDLQDVNGGTVRGKELKTCMENNMKWVWTVDLQAMVVEARNLVLKTA
jgi:salicylate hydroxylase